MGYKNDSEQHFQIDPITAPAVLEAFKHYAEGDSMTDVVKEMNTNAKSGKIIAFDKEFND